MITLLLVAMYIAASVVSMCITLACAQGQGLKCGLLARAGSCWIGAHYSEHNRRWCINFLPCVTVWVCMPNGVIPTRH